MRSITALSGVFFERREVRLVPILHPNRITRDVISCCRLFDRLVQTVAFVRKWKEQTHLWEIFARKHLGPVVASTRLIRLYSCFHRIVTLESSLLSDPLD